MEATQSPFTVVSPSRAWRYLWYTLALLVVIGLVTALTVSSLNEPPADFPVATPVTVTEGSSIREIVEQFKTANIVQSELLLYVIILTRYTPSDVKASTYVFDQPYTTFAIAEKLATGDFTSNLVRLTHKEGERVSELAVAVHDALPSISVEEFTADATQFEGYLWPETYFVPPEFTTGKIITLMRTAHEEFMAEHQEAIDAHELTPAEIVILASIIEREANSVESMAMVSGILQNRMEIDMPLQADASIEYVLDKPLAELTPADLDIDSPYNTYLNRGLPPTPIGNPGANAILSVLYPTESNYLFYITGDDGNFYYAETYDEHRANIAKYLR